MNELYSAVREKMQPLDLISFSGDGFVSEVIKKKTDSDISHVALVYRVLDWHQVERVQIIESTSLLTLPDKETGELIKGVQVHALSERLKTYSGKIYWHKLNVPLSDAYQAAAYSWLYLVHQQRVKYDTVGAIRAGVDIWDYMEKMKPNYEKLFCSEMAAGAYQKAGLFFGNPSEETPDDVVKYPFISEGILIKE